jgi:hypothetical protein
MPKHRTQSSPTPWTTTSNLAVRRLFFLLHGEAAVSRRERFLYGVFMKRSIRLT